MSCTKICNSKLVGKNTVCANTITEDLTFARRREERLVEYPLKKNNSDYQFSFFTRTRDPKNSRRYIRKLCVKKADKDKNYLYKDVTPGVEIPKNFDIRLEICEDRKEITNVKSKVVTDDTVIPFQTLNKDNKNAPTIFSKIRLNTLTDDGIILPANLNGKFYVRLYAIGKQNKEHKVRLNCMFYIEYGGDIPNESESITNQSLAVGESKVVAGGFKN
tara:strand:- start:301 stop:954 length:654 start_codon:yes stop_codon:yes gene_type:complete